MGWAISKTYIKKQQHGSVGSQPAEREGAQGVDQEVLHSGALLRDDRVLELPGVLPHVADAGAARVPSGDIALPTIFHCQGVAVGPTAPPPYPVPSCPKNTRLLFFTGVPWSQAICPPLVESWVGLQQIGSPIYKYLASGCEVTAGSSLGSCKLK